MPLKNYTSNFFNLLLFVVFSTFSLALAGQNVTLDYDNPSSLHVCDSAKFEVTLKAGNDSMVNNLTVEIWFPKGISYSLGTVEDAMESDVSNLQRPVFSLPNLSPGQEVTFSVWAFGECRLVSDINSGKLFSNTITANYDGGSERLITQPYNVETGLLVITEISPEVTNGQFGNVISRRVSVRNTRLGRLSSFTFRDSHDAGFSIETDGDNVVETPVFYQAEFSARHFRQIGDGDDFFEEGEKLIIDEQMLIEDCGTPELQNISVITVLWGCRGEVCQSTTRAATLNIKRFDGEGKLSFKPEIQVPPNFCVDQTYFEVLTITNTGQASVQDFTVSLFEIDTISTRQTGMVLSSLTVDSAGQNIPFQVTGQAPLNLSDCPDLTDLNAQVDLLFSNLAPGESIVLRWETQYCQVDCSSNIPPMNYRYKYARQCPPGQEVEGSGAGSFADSDQLMKDSVSFYIGRFVLDNNRYDFRYDVFSELIRDSTGILAIDIEMPCMFDWQNNPFILDGKPPIQTNITGTPETGMNIHLEYQLPFSSEHAFSEFSLNFACVDDCLPNVPDFDLYSPLSSCGNPEFIWSGRTGIVDSLGRIPIGIVGNRRFNVKSAFIPDTGPQSCGVTDCEEFELVYLCLKDSADLFTIQVPSYLDYESQYYRDNIGLQDDNDDRIADSNNPATISAIRRDRFIPGDTAVSFIEGTVVNDVPGHTSNFIRFRVDFEGHLIDDGIDGGSAVRTENDTLVRRDSTLFYALSGIQEIDATLSILDQSTGEIFTCDIKATAVEEDQIQTLSIVNTRPPDIYDEWRRLTYFYDVDVRNALGTNCSIPRGFVLEEGDFVQLRLKHRMIYNPGSRVLNMRQVSAVSMFNSDDSPLTRITCGRPIRTFQLSGYSVNRILGNFTAVPCGEFSESVGSGFNVNLGMTNFFPFEHRNLASVIDWDLILGRGFTLLESRVVNAGHDGLPARHRDVLLTPNILGDTYVYNLLQFQDPPFDEGFYINLFHLFESEPIACSFEDRTPVSLHSRVEFNHDFPRLPDFFDDTNQSSVGIQPLVPDLKAVADNPVVTSNTNSVNWDFMIENSEIYPSENTWIVVESPSNGVFNFNLTDTRTGQQIPSNNDVFQIGTIGAEDFGDYNLSADFNLCSDTILVIFGWNCTPINSTAEFACHRDTFQLVLNSPLGELEMGITSPTDPVQLCSEVPFHIVEVFNADLGTAFDLKLKALLPPGITVVPGSSQIAYTTDAGNFVNVSDPTDLGAGNYEWDISTLQSTIGSDGLPGVQNEPRNSLSLRFLGFTECGLIASAPIIFNISGAQSCDEPINTLSKVSDEIEVEGVLAGYETQIAPVGQPEAGCGENLKLEIDVRVLGTTLAGDSIFITLPEGVDYIAGSYNPISNAVSGGPTVESRGSFDVLKWEMQAGLSNNSTITFSLETTGYGDLGCEAVTIQVQTIQSTEALCQTTGELCPVLVQTGDALIVVDILSPEFTFDEFSATAATGGVDFILEIGNIGANTNAPVVVDFYIDSDGNGFFSPGDMFLDSQTFTGGILAGDQIQLMGTLGVSDDEICRIIAVIDPDKNCSCSFDQIIIRAQQSAQNTIEVCSGDVMQIGVNEESGNIYSWNNPENISCTNCATADFVFQNVGSDTVSFNYVLTDDNGVCPTQNLITVIVYPEPRLLTEDTTICEGIAVELITITAESYTWTGPGIVDPTAQNQTVTPSQSATYTVLMENSFGCSETESIEIEVIPGPIADAGQDTTLCESTTGFQLNAYSDSSYSYIWRPVHLLSDIFSPNPIISPSQTSDFVLQVTDNRTGCVMFDTVFVAFSEAPELSISGDVTICLGDSVLLSVSGAEEYIWQPFANLSCGDCPFPYAKPSTPTTYTVTGINGGECDSEETIFVDIEGEVTFLEIDTTLCADDSLLVGGFWIKTDTMLPDIIKTFDECDTIIDYDISFIPDSIVTNVFLCPENSITICDTTYSEPGRFPPRIIETGQCKTVCIVNIEAAPVPSHPTPDSIIIEIGDSTELTLDEGFDIYEWLQDPDSTLSCTDCQTTIASPEETTEYSGVVFNEVGCSDTITFRVVVVSECDPENVIIPNIFSPNNDGLNDEFRPMIPNYIEEIVSIKVWNRWGEKVYEGAGANAGWDGLFKNEQSMSDVYIYRIDIGCEDELKAREGDVTLYR